jgi:hypothetical protein
MQADACQGHVGQDLAVMLSCIVINGSWFRAPGIDMVGGESMMTWFYVCT